MNANIENTIRPPAEVQPSRPSGIKTDPTGVVRGKGADSEVDFLSVLGNANQDVASERKAKENGTDLGSSKNYDEFLDKLADKTEKQRTPKNTLDKDDFLNLFVTQLKHQDPLNPQDSSEMASRLAHFNSLEQMLNVNKTLDKMLVGQQTGRNSELINYIGKEVMIDDGRLKVDKGELADGRFTLDHGANNVKMRVRDGSGGVVATEDLGPMPMGEHKIQWNARNKEGSAVNDGIYTFELFAEDMDKNEVPIGLKSQAKITAVDLKNPDGLVFTSLGKVAFEKIGFVGVKGFDKVAAEAPKGLDAKDSGQTPQREASGPEDVPAGEQVSAEQTTKPTLRPKPVVSPVASLAAALRQKQAQQAPATNTVPER